MGMSNLYHDITLDLNPNLLLQLLQKANKMEKLHLEKVVWSKIAR